MCPVKLTRAAFTLKTYKTTYFRDLFTATGQYLLLGYWWNQKFKRNELAVGKHFSDILPCPEAYGCFPAMQGAMQ